MTVLLSKFRRLFAGGDRLTPEQARRMRPRRKHGILSEPGEAGSTVLMAPLDAVEPMWSRLLSRRPESESVMKRFELEPVGAFVWELCDGKHTFGAIAQKLRERFKMNRLEAETALAAFLQTLGRRGLIELDLPRK